MWYLYVVVLHSTEMQVVRKTHLSTTYLLKQAQQQQEQQPQPPQYEFKYCIATNDKA